jgi:hypothetical protein
MTNPRSGRALTTADVVRVAGLELRLAWTVASEGRPRTSGYQGELFRVAALVADLSTGYDWAISVSHGFDAREIGPNHWRVLTNIRIDPYSGSDEEAMAKALLESIAALL